MTVPLLLFHCKWSLAIFLSPIPCPSDPLRRRSAMSRAAWRTHTYRWKRLYDEVRFQRHTGTIGSFGVLMRPAVCPPTKPVTNCPPVVIDTEYPQYLAALKHELVGCAPLVGMD